MRNKLLASVSIFLLVLTFILLTYFKSKYAILFLIIFSSEYLYFINYLTKFYSYKKKTEYQILKINKRDYNDMSVLEIWNNIGEILAFKRLYALVCKKKIHPKQLLIATFVIFFCIPLKVIKILLFFFNSSGNFKESLIFFYLKNYTQVENLKIEFIDKKFYINCSTREVIYRVIFTRQRMSAEEGLQYFKKLQLINNRFNEFEKNLNNRLPFKLGTLKTEEGYRVPKGHWSIENKFTVKKTNESVRALVHATSNIPGDLAASQLSSFAMKDLIKPGSRDSGTVWTKGRFLFKVSSSRTLWIPQWQVNYLTYEIYGETTQSVNFEYFVEKKETYSDVLNIDKNAKIVSELCLGLHDTSLLSNVSDGTLLDEMRVFKEANNL